jgi:hypothetical protein
MNDGPARHRCSVFQLLRLLRKAIAAGNELGRVPLMVAAEHETQ